MLFLSEAVQKARQDVIRRMQAGEVSRDEAGRCLLELVPDDAFACYVRGIASVERNDFESARDLFWRAIQLQPAHSMGYVGLSNALQQSGSDPELAHSLAPLSLRRMLRNPDQAALVEERWMTRMREMLGTDIDPELGLAAADALSMTTKDEPERVTALLRPYRLVQDVIDRPEQGIPETTVAAIIGEGAACAPLLVGVLRGSARTGSDDYTSVEAALALLGETGGADALPPVLEYTEDEDEGIAEAALWAAHRLLARHPEAARTAPRLEPFDTDLTVYDFCCYDDTGDEQDYEGEDEDEDEDEEITPVHAEPTPGRNDPCWCGSGKKYKKCHLAEDEAGGREAGTMEDRLMDLAGSWLSRSELRAAEVLFTDDPDAEVTGENELLFYDWLVHDYVHPRLGRTVPQEYARRHGPSPEIRNWMEARFSLYEVLRTEPGKGMELRNLLLESTCFVQAASASYSISPGEWLLARVRDESGRLSLSSAIPVPAGYREEFRSWIIAGQAQSGRDWSDWLSANSHLLRIKLLDMGVDFREKLKVLTPEGDPIAVSTASFEVLDEPALRAALQSAPVIDTTPDAWLWIESRESKRLLGTLRLKEGSLILECLSRERLDRGIEVVKRIAGRTVGFSPPSSLA